MLSISSPHLLNVTLGVTLATPFLANITPDPLLPALLIIPIVFVLLVAYERPSVPLSFISSFSRPVVVLIWLLVLFQVVGLLQSENPFQYRLLKDLIFAFTVAALASVSVCQIRDEESAFGVQFGFLSVIVFFAIVFSFVGLFKFYLLQQGVAIDMIRSGDRYPWGSSLKTDYNFFSLTILIAIVGLIDYYHRAKPGIRAALLAIALGVVVTGGIYAGSRRFWLLSPLIIVISLLSVWFRSQNRKAVVVDSAKLVLVVVPVILTSVVFLELSTASDVEGRRHHFESSTDGVLDSSVQSALDADLLARVETLVSPGERFGIGSRSDRWKYAFELMNVRTLLFGMGFDYINLYSCRFLDCRVADYPHSPLLSALLYGGIVSAVVAILFVLWLAYTAVRLIRARNGKSIVGVALLAVIPFHLISGDTFFSLPGLMTAAILASVVTMRFDSSALASESSSRRHVFF